jgi:hypothetical protein
MAIPLKVKNDLVDNPEPTDCAALLIQEEISAGEVSGGISLTS